MKVQKNTIYLFFISFLAPEISAFKEVLNDTKNGSPIVRLCQNFAKVAKFVTSVDLHVHRQIMKSTITC